MPKYTHARRRREPLDGFLSVNDRPTANFLGDGSKEKAAVTGLSTPAVSLDAESREFVENRFGHDFSRVRIHADATADSSAGALGALAYVVGEDVVFRSDAYQPESPKGRLLLAHELTHVVQNEQGGVENGGELTLSHPTDAAEQEANQAAVEVMTGATPEVRSAPTASIAREEESTLGTLWNILSNNAHSGAAGLLAAAADAPLLARMGDAVGAPIFGSARAGEGLARLGSTPGVSTISNILGPIGLISGIMGMQEAASKPKSLTNMGDFVSSGLGAVSGGITTLGLAGSGLTALGATGAGATLSGAAAAAGPVGAVAGAGAGGYAAGRLIDEGVGWLMNATGAGGLLDSARGISRPEGQHGDYSISGMGADVATALDQGTTGIMRSIGILDESKPAYTQTLGWKLAEILPSWMQ
jgi:hypothetical protein